MHRFGEQLPLRIGKPMRSADAGSTITAPPYSSSPMIAGLPVIIA
jgi:hypothetical protein